MARPVLPGLLVAVGGVAVLLAGLVLIGVGGDGGEIGAGVGGLTILVGVLIPLVPGQRTVLAFTAATLSIISIFYAVAGFIVGFFLVMLGALLAYIWVPPSAGTGAPASDRPDAG